MSSLTQDLRSPTKNQEFTAMYSEDHWARSERTAAPSEYVALGGQAPLSAETGQWLTDGVVLCALKIEGL